jgi:pimeloyl-ACP methyl ester carboxylesterase
MSGYVINEVRIGGERRLSTRRWSGEGDPLVLLHGLFDSSAGWDRLAAGTTRPCVAFDLPGFGSSAGPRQPVIASYADDVLAGVEQLGLEQFTLVGHSLGGAIATSVAERCDEVRSLALLAPAGFGPIHLADLFVLPVIHRVAMTALPFALMTPPLVLGGYMTFVSHRRRPTRELVSRVRGDAWHTANGVGAAIHALHHCTHAADSFRHRQVMFDGPVAAVWGEHDALVPPSHATGLRDALPQARVEIWPGMAHHPQHERSAELARFIERCARAAQPRTRTIELLAPPAAPRREAA